MGHEMQIIFGDPLEMILGTLFLAGRLKKVRSAVYC